MAVYAKETTNNDNRLLAKKFSATTYNKALINIQT